MGCDQSKNNKIVFVTDSMDINSRYSESHSVARSSHVKMDSIKEDFSRATRRKYMSQTARRDLKKKKQNL